MRKTILIVDEELSKKSLILTLIAEGLESITPMVFVGEKIEETILDMVLTPLLIVNRIEIDDLYFLKTNSFSSRKWLHEKRGAKKLFKVSRQNYRQRNNNRRSREYRTRACSD